MPNTSEGRDDRSRHGPQGHGAGTWQIDSFRAIPLFNWLEPTGAGRRTPTRATPGGSWLNSPRPVDVGTKAQRQDRTASGKGARLEWTRDRGAHNGGHQCPDPDA